MAKTVTLKDHKDNTTVYPQTLTKCVQDEEGKTLDYLVLMKDNTTEFTPTADYQPATKKYVDDKIHISTADPTASDGNNGDIWLKYEA